MAKQLNSSKDNKNAYHFLNKDQPSSLILGQNKRSKVIALSKKVFVKSLCSSNCPIGQNFQQNVSNVRIKTVIRESIIVLIFTIFFQLHALNSLD
jgi:hypothetical protein